MQTANLSINVIVQFLKRDLTIFFRQYPGKLLDCVILFFTTSVVFGYWMPQLSEEGYGVFIAFAAIGMFGFFEVIGRVFQLLGDIEGAQTIKQSLLYPIRSEWIFIYTAGIWSLYTMLLGAPLLICAKLFLWNQFELGGIHWVRFCTIFLTANFFHGFFALWLSAVLKAMRQAESLYFRIVNPLFMFGAYFYSWMSLYAKTPLIAKLTLINPLVYVCEGFHAAGLGQEGFLPFWVCVGMLWIFILLFGAHSVQKLKRRLDCV